MYATALGKWQGQVRDSNHFRYFLMTHSSFFNSETQEVAGQKEKLLGKIEAFQKGSLR